MKTIEEGYRDALKKAKDSTPLKDDFPIPEDFRNGFKAGVEFAQKWYSVEDELPDNTNELIVNGIKSKNVLIKRKWFDNGEIAIEVNCRFRPSERIGYIWNIQYEGSKITHWRPIEIINK
jgi:hypothetical protein